MVEACTIGGIADGFPPSRLGVRILCCCCRVAVRRRWSPRCSGTPPAVASRVQPVPRRCRYLPPESWSMGPPRGRFPVPGIRSGSHPANKPRCSVPGVTPSKLKAPFVLTGTLEIRIRKHQAGVVQGRAIGVESSQDWLVGFHPPLDSDATGDGIVNSLQSIFIKCETLHRGSEQISGDEKSMWSVVSASAP